MSVQQVKDYLKSYGQNQDILEFPVSSATVALAAQALQVEEGRIAKTLSFYQEDHALLVVVAGNVKIDNAKFRHFFHMKAHMIAYDEVERLTGHPVGGVCPFAVKEDTVIWLDESLKQYDTVFPAAGSSSSAIEMSCAELERCTRCHGWTDVSKPSE